MKSIFRQLIFIFLVFTLPKFSKAQDTLPVLTDYSVRQFTNANGLPQNSIKKIVQDPNGFIWLATKSGLVDLFKWHETWWTMAGTLLLLTGLIYLIVKLRTRILEKRNKKLELQISERTVHLEYMLEAVRFSENELARHVKLHRHMIASISHDIQSPVKFLISASERLKAFVLVGNIHSVIEVNGAMVYTLDKLYLLIDSMLTFIKSNTHQDKIEKSRTNLLELVLKKTAIFREIIKMHKGTINIDIPADLFVDTHASLMGVIIHNLVDNAIKVKSENEITVNAGSERGKIYLTIADKGPGIPDNTIKWLNNSTLKEDKEVLSHQNHEGLGLVLVKEVSQLLDLTLQVRNQNGAHITFLFNN